MSSQLERYQSKRDFSRTTEPRGDNTTGNDEARYVMHKHAASHDHFDLRLEQDGVLRSWALPKGPSLASGEKRLAVEVEDHPREYGNFEGVIPKDAYGGGTVMLWDRGTWSPRNKPGADRIDFELQGEKLSGHWTLVRMHGKKADDRKNNRNWLLIKRSGGSVEEPDDRSVATRRTMEEIARQEGDNDSQSKAPVRVDLPGARKKPLAELAPVQLATLASEPPSGDDWLHELKFDGYRILARIDQDEVRLFTRNGKDWTHRFKAIAQSLHQLPVEHAWLDGEVIAPEEDGSSSFRKLQETLSRGGVENRGSLVYQVFDLLHLEDRNLERTPLLDRKAALEQLLSATGDLAGLVRYSDHVRGNGDGFYRQVCEMGLEGMVSKRRDAGYRSGRQRAWQKTKCTGQDEFVVGGFSAPSGSRQGFGALLLGVYEGDTLNYVGRVGAGFSGHQLASLHKELRAQQRKQSPFAGDVPDTKDVQWVRPTLVVDVEFTETTRSGALRHPVFRGVREDKTPGDIQAGRSRTSSKSEPPDDDPQPRRKAVRKRSGDPVVAGVPISHPDRLIYPDQGITKLEVARYYEDAQHHILPHLAHRPLVLLRCPGDVSEECFFQKQPGQGFAPDVPRVTIAGNRSATTDYVYVTQASELIWLVQFGALEFHPWGSRVDQLEKPDTLIFDLDPGPGVSWRTISTTAQALRERLDDLGLASFLKATGGKGLHLVAPIEPEWPWHDIKDFAHGIARAHVRDAPQTTTTNMAKTKRKGKVFLDYLRNGRGNTGIASYSLRAREGAPVSVPLRWDELSSGASSNRYTLHNVRRRLSALKADPWQDYERARTRIPADLLKRYQKE